MIGLAAAIAVAAIFPAPAQSSSATEWQALSKDELARRLLGPAGAAVNEARLRDEAGEEFAAEFASKPRLSTFPGVCEANVYTVWFKSGAEGPRVSAIRPEKFFRVIGASRFDVLRDGKAECERAGPVLGGPTPFFSTGPLFSNSATSADAGQIWFVAKVFELARVGAGSLDCSKARNDANCGKSRAAIARLSEGDIGTTRLSICRRDPSRLCLSVRLALPGERFPFLHYLQVETDARRIPAAPEDFKLISLRSEEIYVE